MTKKLEELGKLKRSLEVEIPLEDIKQTYNQVFRHIKSHRMSGFRPGKFPKGWLDKRFKQAMAHEATERVIPNRFNEIVAEMELLPATQAVIEELDFDKNKPLKFKLTFEVQPELELPDYQKINLEKQNEAATAEEIDDMIDRFRKNQAAFHKKAEGSAAAEGDQVVVDFDRTIGEDTVEERKQKIYLDANMLADIKSNIIGMTVGETKDFSFTITEEYLPEHVGATVHFHLTLQELDESVLPELNEDFFAAVNPDIKTEEDLREFAKTNVLDQKKWTSRMAYHQSVRDQIADCYDEFDLPETLLEEQEKQTEADIKKEQENITEEELEKQKAERMQSFKKGLRVDYILQQISAKKSLIPSQELIFKRFTSMANLYGQDPGELMKSQYGGMFYQQIVRQLSEETVLDYIVDQILGEPEEPAAVVAE
ncbi:MAG: trigger factor [SAR324 cluster bacterium]|nr:trigger factor [SAR324 cluster bacterium]